MLFLSPGYNGVCLSCLVRVVTYYVLTTIKLYILKCPERRIWVTTSSLEKGITTVLPNEAVGALSLCLSLRGWEVAGPLELRSIAGVRNKISFFFDWQCRDDGVVVNVE